MGEATVEGLVQMARLDPQGLIPKAPEQNLRLKLPFSGASLKFLEGEYKLPENFGNLPRVDQDIILEDLNRVKVQQEG